MCGTKAGIRSTQRSLILNIFYVSYVIRGWKTKTANRWPTDVIFISEDSTTINMTNYKYVALVD